ncbi:hypothetical protein [Salidesulfovibrio onnuriiensis]|uniref:hypothetical protein n=1 Tax=Salidesulfovibrio onnuriiensis TaxID=2583823 RepID=UPI0011CC9796|nr:hypothetical protein [Salidesulfovibrio onnuriiensis]
MKKLMFAFALVLLLCGSAVAVEDCFNAQGSALVPDVKSRYGNNSQFIITCMTISNITDSAVTCRVNVYDDFGNDVSTSCHVSVGGVAGGFKYESTGQNTFELAAHATRTYVFKSSSIGMAGYAVIEWTSTNKKLRKALIASSRYEGMAGSYFASRSLVNNGQPF